MKSYYTTYSEYKREGGKERERYNYRGNSDPPFDKSDDQIEFRAKVLDCWTPSTDLPPKNVVEDLC